MSAITFVNAADGPAEFFLFQDGNSVARLCLAEGGSAKIPVTAEYAAQAFTSMGEFSLASNVVFFTATSITLMAQVVVENGYYDFQLVEKPGISPLAITLENTWSAPVQFRLTRSNSPFHIVTVVDENSYANISTAQQWKAYAVVGGATTGAVEFSGPNGTVRLIPGKDGGFTLSVA